MFGRLSWLRRAVVVVGVVLIPLLVISGLLGGGYHRERFDAKQIVVTPSGSDGVRIREVVDQDFGSFRRHGYERVIPNDAGGVVDIEAESADDEIPAEVSELNLGAATQIRIGDPLVTADGQHRFVLAYTLPELGVSSGKLELDIIDPDEDLSTGRFEVVLDGFRLEDPICSVGDAGDLRGCELVADGPLYRVVFEPLPASDGITITGSIVELTDPIGVPDPPLPDRRPDRRAWGALVLLLAGLAIAAGVYVRSARQGRNVVGAGGAVDAAHADQLTGGPTRLVTDRGLRAMATIEFAPPADMHPWEGTVLLDEGVSSRSVSAWFAEQIARDVLVLDPDARRLDRGPRWREADITTMDRVRDMFEGSDSLDLRYHNPGLRTVWDRVTSEQRKRSRSWWEASAGPRARSSTGSILLVVFGGPLLAVAAVILAVFGLHRSWTMCAIYVAAIVATTATFAFAPLRARRSAVGSALALRVESFRRFLAASEGSHVDWAWERGLVREYTAWAVALGVSAAWGRAIAASAASAEIDATLLSPRTIERNLSFIASSTISPASGSGGGGGGGSSSGGSSGFSSGGFSAGSVGSGGGGGSSGSW